MNSREDCELSPTQDKTTEWARRESERRLLSVSSTEGPTTNENRRKDSKKSPLRGLILTFTVLCVIGLLVTLVVLIVSGVASFGGKPKTRRGVITDDGNNGVQYFSLATTQNDNDFVTLTLGDEETCTNEYKDNVFNCNWRSMTLRDQPTNQFTSTEKIDGCIPQDIFSGAKNTPFFKHDDTGSVYLVSPLIQGKGSFRLSFWSFIRCTGPSLKVYVVPEGNTIAVSQPNDVISFPYEILQGVVYENTNSYDWTMSSFDLFLPEHEEGEKFQVVIVGTISPNSNCTSSYCVEPNLDKMYWSKYEHHDVTSPLVAIDNINIILHHPECIGTNNAASDVLDCDFSVPISEDEQEDDDDEYDPYEEDDMYWDEYYYDYNPDIKEFCKWRSSPEYDHHKTSSHWKAIGNLTDVNIRVKLIQGRGHVAHFDATGNGFTRPFLRSSKVIANSNCLCHLSLKFMFLGNLETHLQVNKVYENGNRITLWSISAELRFRVWREATVPLHMDAASPFQVEVMATNIINSWSDIFVDDIKFHNCDFRLSV